MKRSVKGALGFSGVIIMAFIIGDFMMTAAFFGCITLLGLVMLVKSMPWLERFIARTSSFLDVCIFVFTIMATASFGLNITAALTIAGLGFTMVYAPYLKENYTPKDKNKRRKMGAREGMDFR